MNQQQLQTARAALWHQNAAPLVTYDDAAAWLKATEICLFLPRHTQLPAPAPSFVEACMGATSVTPPADVIAHATELAVRLIDAGRAIPLNLLGTFSEQPDFLITPDVLPWVAAIRGDRQWKTAPSGHPAPIVVRTWEALEKQGSQTAVEIRELLGRELTEAAVLRALIELWTNLRAIPAYVPDEPTRWSLLKERHAAQLTTAANTALPTALSAMLSLYLRSAVAATAEEAEIFLSPLTARSRIRDVLHGMTAARQFGTMSVGSHTLLFVEGSLPETAPTPQQTAEMAPATAPPPPQEGRARREAIRKRPREEERSTRPRAGLPREARPPRRDFRPGASGGERPRGKPFAPRPSFQKKDGPPRERKFPRRFAAADRPPAQDAPAPRPDARPPFAGAKPWQKRPAGKFTKRPDRPPFRRPDQQGDRPRTGRTAGPPRPWQKDRPRPEGSPTPEGRPPFPRREGQSDRPRREERGPSQFRPRPGFGPKRFDRPGSKQSERSGAKRFDRPRSERPARPGFSEKRPPRADRGDDRRAPFTPSTTPSSEGQPPRPVKKFGAKPGFLRPGPGQPRFGASSRPAGKAGAERSAPGKFGPRKFGGSAGKPGRFGQAKSGPGKFGGAKPAFRKTGPAQFDGPPSGARKFGAENVRNPAQRSKKTGEFRKSQPPRKKFGKPGAPARNPGKNRKQEDKPE